MTAMGSEPDLRLGDSGEWVTNLQQRLQALSLYHGSVDGNYGEDTDAAVRQLAESTGVEHAGTVTAQTWQALAQQEQHAGVAHGAGQDGAYGTEQAAVPAGQLSEDGQWRWSGTDWQPAAQDQSVHPGEGVPDTQAGQLSEDGQWRWDGTQWQPAGQDQTGAAAQAGGERYTVAVNDEIDDPATEEAAVVV